MYISFWTERLLDLVFKDFITKQSIISLSHVIIFQSLSRTNWFLSMLNKQLHEQRVIPNKKVRKVQTKTNFGQTFQVSKTFPRSPGVRNHNDSPVPRGLKIWSRAESLKLTDILFASVKKWDRKFRVLRDTDYSLETATRWRWRREVSSSSAISRNECEYARNVTFFKLKHNS